MINISELRAKIQDRLVEIRGEIEEIKGDDDYTELQAQNDTFEEVLTMIDGES